MKIRALHRLLAALMVGLFSLPAIAQYSRDASAGKKIDEAINNHYLMMELDKAESLLTGTVAACEDKCSPATKAKAWMYVGIVRGSGKSDQSGAAEAFATAKGIDPSIRLDEALATPETKATFEATVGSGGGPSPSPSPSPSHSSGPAPGAAPPPAGVPGDMLCSPQGADIQTNMPIPISCSSDAAVTEGFVKFQEPGASDWKKLSLVDVMGQWQAEIPCKFTTKAGQLKFYIGVKDGSGEYVDQFGSKTMPATLNISETGVAPAFPGQAPVARCGGTDTGASDCPPDFPGCESSSDTQQCGDLDWGASCNNSSQCKCGLLCESGQCATAPTCTADEECDTGSCVDGYCSAVSGSDGAGGPFKRWWLGVTVGMDLMPLGGENLCSASEEFDVTYGIQCYNAAGERTQLENVNIGTGAAPAQLRAKLGLDYAATHHLLLGVRLGAGFLNSHPSAQNEPAFLPIHAEGRVSYSFTSLGHEGLRPVLYVAGGFAESNARLVAGDTQVYKVAGRIFAAPGGQFGYYFSPNVGINADVQLMLLFPAGGMAIAIHPALNFTYGL